MPADAYWNRCIYCGRFIRWGDFDHGPNGRKAKAVRTLVTPDAEGTTETWETYHVRCYKEADDAH